MKHSCYQTKKEGVRDENQVLELGVSCCKIGTTRREEYEKVFKYVARVCDDC